MRAAANDSLDPFAALAFLRRGHTSGADDVLLIASYRNRSC